MPHSLERTGSVSTQIADPGIQVSQPAGDETVVAAQILVVQTEPDFLDQIVTMLSRAGHTVHPYLDPMAALDALESLAQVDLLITRVRFGEGNPHGIALALMAHTMRHGIKVIFTARQEFAVEAEGLGEFMIAPVSVSDLEETVARLLNAGGES